MQQKTQAIILRRVAYGDADWIVTFFTRDRGRMSGMARSARASKRRFAGSLEPGQLVNLRYFERRGSDLVRIDESTTVRPVNGVMKSLDRINAMTLGLELALNFLQEHQATPDKFDMMNEYLAALNDHDPTVWDILVYEYRWLAHCGFRPNFINCMSCSRDTTGGGSWMFDLDQGSLLCTSCKSPGGGRIVLTNGVLGTLTGLSDGVLEGELQHAVQAEGILRRYVGRVLGKNLKSPAL